MKLLFQEGMTVENFASTGLIAILVVRLTTVRMKLFLKNQDFFPDGVSELHTVVIPISGPYLLSLGCQLIGHAGGIFVKRNTKQKLLDGGRTDIVDLTEDDILEVYAESGTKFKDLNFMGFLLRPRVFIQPGSTL